MTKEREFINQAVQVGLEGMRNNLGGPFGCVIVKNNEVIGKGCNSVIALNDPTAHAEIVAIRDACNNLQSFRLNDCEVYTTCEPCPMCMGALYWARPKKVYYASSRADAANLGFDDNYIYEQIALPVEQRKIEMECLQCDEAKEMFEEWRHLNNRTLY